MRPSFQVYPVAGVRMKMVKMVNFYSGNTMYVAEERLQEYLDAGHRMAEPEKPEKPEKPAKPKKRTAKK